MTGVLDHGEHIQGMRHGLPALQRSQPAGALAGCGVLSGGKGHRHIAADHTLRSRPRPLMRAGISFVGDTHLFNHTRILGELIGVMTRSSSRAAAHRKNQFFELAAIWGR